MKEAVDLKLYTVDQVRAWLVHNEDIAGLTERLIDKTRANALVTNPYVRDDMAIISAIFVNGTVAAYTYVFPDLMERPENRLIYWNTTLYVNPKYEGRGYAYCVIAQICELYGDDYFDLDAAEASVENLKYQGLTVKYVPQYILRNKSIKRTSLKGSVAFFVEKMRKSICSREKALRFDIANSTYKLQYVNTIDDDLYTFIKDHSGNDVFLRKRETFNWILQQPFMQETPVYYRVQKKCVFSSAKQEFRLYGIVIRNQEKVVGFVILRATSEEWAVKYIYYDKEAQKDVFFAIAEHIICKKRDSFITTDKALHDFIRDYSIFPIDAIYQKSFSYPHSFEYAEENIIQNGDGDNIT